MATSTGGTWNGRAGFFRAPPRAIPDGADLPAWHGRAAGDHCLSAVAVVRAVLLLVLTACIAGTPDRAAAQPAAIAPDIGARLSRLDCSRLDGQAVKAVLAHSPAPRIVLLQGSFAFVTMEPFARFLIGMGYPPERLRNPRDGGFSYGSFADSASLAGALAFDYEQTGMEPVLIGHSQGGMLAIRVLHEFAGAFHDTLPVVDPATGVALDRTTIIDPHTHRARPVVGLHVAYAAALATGWLPRVLLGQWTMLPRLRQVPDTVTEFTGFDIPHDAIAGQLFGAAPYVALGTARVRNVALPAGYSHVALPSADHLPDDPNLREWIDAWFPDADPPLPAGETANIVHAADIWHSVKRHWCRQARRLLGLQ
jgi:hypothetical protein